MKRLLDWYWVYGNRRPAEWSISPLALNNIYGMSNQEEAIQKIMLEGREKACVAFWGPSQSGKSSLLSHYMDGESNADLALMWDENQRVRFSATEETDAGDVVFNPFNGAMDASGLVTRFYLPTEEELDSIDPLAPVEVILSNRKQVMHAISVGYRMECQESENPWGLDALDKKISKPSVHPNRDAFELLFDVCDVCEDLARESSRYREFLRGQNLRKKILSSSCVDKLEDAEMLAMYLLWDGENALTKLFNEIIAFQKDIESFFGNDVKRRIFVSMEVAALLEDIGILSFYAQNKDKTANRRINALKNVRLHITPRGLIFICNGDKIADQIKSSKKISIKGFGRFQALISELRIPLREKTSKETKPFFNFLKKCDLLDIPGVTNRASGEALGVENLIDLHTVNCEEPLLLARVYKSGKTLSIIYNQARNCSIDAFVIFVDLERAGGITRPTTLVNGVKAWLSPYGFDSFNLQPPLKLYLNCSLFGKLLGSAPAAAQSGGLSNYCEKVASLDFSFSPYVDRFFTTNCFSPCENVASKHYFEEDRDFSRTFLEKGDGQRALDALFSDGLGTDFMFNKLSDEISTQTRLSHYEIIKIKDKTTLKSNLSRLLPDGQANTVMIRKEVVKRVYSRLSQQIDPNNPTYVKKLAGLVKEIFVVDETMLDMIPKNPHHVHESILKQYLLQQIYKWVMARKEDFSGRDDLEWILSEDEINPFFESLASVDLGRIIDLLKTDFWDHNPKVSRSFLAVVLNNYFLSGDYERKPSVSHTDSYEMLCVPFLTRLEQLSKMQYEQEGGRPANLVGDIELIEIVNALQLM